MPLFDQNPDAFMHYINDTFRPQHQVMVGKILEQFSWAPAGLLFICSYLTKAEVVGKMDEALVAADNMLDKHFAYRAPEERHIITDEDIQVAMMAYAAIGLRFPAHS